MDELKSSNEAENLRKFTVFFHVNQGDGSSLSQDAQELLSCATCGQKKEIRNIYKGSDQIKQQCLLDRNRQVQKGRI